MKKVKVGFQGVSGSFSEEALFLYFKENFETVTVPEFEDIFKGIINNDFDYGILPLENSSTGAITHVYDLLNQNEVYIIGETFLKVKHHLLALPQADIEDIKEVYSHPQGFEQSRPFLKMYPSWKLIPHYNTAKSAELVMKTQNKTMAAIASLRAAELYGLNILREGINTNSSNTTRFITLGKNLTFEEQSNKVSIVLATKHTAGSLYKVLKNFAENSINMLKIESRPIPDRPWEYFFYVDFEGNLEDGKILKTIDRIKEDSEYFKMLGNYKKAEELAR
ncbi:MAG: prephenate dehydratase [Alkaliphilus sp.]|nr:prephenate dehydratase [Alkaliphilus sp.]